MTLFQLDKWKTEGIWYPISQYKKETNEIEVVSFQLLYTQYPQGFLSVIAKPYKTIQS